jgi:hypothetical protein
LKSNDRHVFLSHSTRDMESALRICSDLETRGITCWMAPRDIRPGSDWAESIMHGIADARAMILLLTENSNQSAQVRREVEHAVNAEIPIIPVILAGVEPSMALRYYISAHQWLDASGGLTDKFLDTLAMSLRPRETSVSTGESQPAAPVQRSAPADPPAVTPAPPPAVSSGPATQTRIESHPAPPKRKGGGKKVLRTVLIALGILALLFVLTRIRKRVRTTSIYRDATEAFEAGEYSDAIDILARLDGHAVADSMQLAIFREGIEESHRKALWEYERDPEGSLDHLVPVLNLIHRYFQEYGLRNEPETFLYTVYLADALTAFGDFEEAGNTLMELVWNEQSGELREGACVRVLETYITALEVEEDVDSLSILQNSLEALEVLRTDYPGNPMAVPLALTWAAGCLEAGAFEPAFEIARELFISRSEPGVRIHAAEIAAASLMELGLEEEALIWIERSNLPDSAGMPMPPGGPQGPGGPGGPGEPPGQSPETGRQQPGPPQEELNGSR